MLKFVYLQTGTRVSFQQQLRYSISTLLAEMPEASGNILIYTDNPDLYAADAAHVTACGIAAAMHEMTGGGAYFFRAKPCVLLEALRTYKCPCVFLDSDTFARRGFAQTLQAELRQGAVMDKFLRRNPYPECKGFETTLPSGRHYRYEPEKSVMYNSGVIGLHPGHEPVLEDAIGLIDAIRPLTMHTHDQEQFAINEALRLHGVRIGVTQGVLKHYCAKSQKHYMNWRFEKNPEFAPIPVSPARPRITVNKAIGWFFKRASRYSLVNSRAYAKDKRG